MIKLFSYRTKFLLVCIGGFLILQLVSCDNCDDDGGIITSIEGQKLGILFIDQGSSQRVIKYNDGSSGIYDRETITFYDAAQNPIENTFTIDNGVICYTVPLDVDLNGELIFSYFIQFDINEPLIAFELEYIIFDSECQRATLGAVDLRFQGNVNNLVQETIIRINV